MLNVQSLETTSPSFSIFFAIHPYISLQSSYEKFFQSIFLDVLVIITPTTIKIRMPKTYAGTDIRTVSVDRYSQ